MPTIQLNTYDVNSAIMTVCERCVRDNRFLARYELAELLGVSTHYISKLIDEYDWGYIGVYDSKIKISIPPDERLREMIRILYVAKTKKERKVTISRELGDIRLLRIALKRNEIYRPTIRSDRHSYKITTNL